MRDVLIGALMLLVIIIALSLAGCAARAPTRAVITTMQVKVPVKVPTYRAVPSNLAACGSDRPNFRFYAPADPRFSSALKAEDEPKLRAWVDRKQTCIDAWRAWSK